VEGAEGAGEGAGDGDGDGDGDGIGPVASAGPEGWIVPAAAGPGARAWAISRSTGVSDPPAVSGAGSGVSDCGAGVWLAGPSLTVAFVAMLPIASCSGTKCSVTGLPVATISALAIRVLAVCLLSIPVLAISVATVSVAGWAAACRGRPEPTRAIRPKPKLRAKDLPWVSPGAVGSSGEPVVNRLRGTTGSPGVAERG